MSTYELIARAANKRNAEPAQEARSLYEQDSDFREFIDDCAAFRGAEVSWLGEAQ